MRSPNHIAGGIVFTGVFGALMNLNILASPWHIVTCIVASLLPDIDLPHAPAGRLFYPLSIWLNKRYGHRTLSHSLVALAATTAVSSFFLKDVGTWIFFLGYFSHLIFDMMTVQGVPLLYPFYKNPCVLPARPESRFRSDYLTETKIFVFFTFSGIFLYPLFKQGFWTTYNRGFGTMKHLASEFKKSSDLLSCDYEYWIASDTFRGTGYVIAATENKTVLLISDFGFKISDFPAPRTAAIQNQQSEIPNWLILDPPNVIVKSVVPTHTGRKFYIEPVQFYDISADSLNKLLTGKILTEIDVSANKAFTINHNGKTAESKNFKTEYPARLLFQAHDTAVMQESFYYLPNVSIKLKENEMVLIQDEYAMKKRQFETDQIELQSLLRDTTKNLYVRESNLKRLSDLRRKQESPPQLDILRLRQLQFEIAELKHQEQFQNDMRRSEYDRRYADKVRGNVETGFSGGFKEVILK